MSRNALRDIPKKTAAKETKLNSKLTVTELLSGDHGNRVSLYIKVKFTEIVIYFLYSLLLAPTSSKNTNSFWKNPSIASCGKVISSVLL